MAINAGTVYSELILDASKYEQGMEAAQKRMKSFTEELKKAGQDTTEIGKKVTTRVTLPIIGLGAAAIKTAVDFEAAMDEVAAISGATGRDLELLTKKAEEMGATTKFSATDAAAALKFMGQAGWTTQQMLEGIEGVMLLAAASGEDLATTASIVTDSLTAFGMSASEAGRFADLLAKAANATNTDVVLLGESFKYVAPLFGTLKFSAEDAALALGLMANAGIKGSQAGTSLRAAISRLVKPVGEAEDLIKKLEIRITDAQGNTLPFLNIMEQLRDKFSKLTESQKAQYAALLFGQEAMSGMLAIINASEQDFRALVDATRNYNGEAKRMADIMQANLKGQLSNLQSQLEGVAIRIGNMLLPYISDLINGISRAVDWFDSLDESTQASILRFAGLAAVIGPAIMVMGQFASSISSIASLLGTLGGTLGIVSTGMGAAAGAMTTAAGAATTAAGAVGAMGSSISAATLLINPFTLAIGAAAVGGVALANYLSQDVIPAVDLFGGEVSEATKEALDGFLELQKGVKVALDEMYFAGKTVTADMAHEVTKNIQEMGQTLVEGIEKDKQEAISILSSLMSQSTTITKEEQAEILKSVTEGYNEQTRVVEENMKQQLRIIEEALKEKRRLTSEDYQILMELQQQAREAAIKILTENELEQRLIYERMKQNAAQLKAEEAAEVIKNSIKQREAVVAEAEKQYKETVDLILIQKNILGTLAEDQADKLIEEAKRQRDETVREAELMHDKIVTEVQLQLGEYVNAVDLGTGEIKKRWQLLAEEVNKSSTATNQFISSMEEVHRDRFLRMRQQLYEADRAYHDTLAEGGTIIQAINASQNKLREFEQQHEQTKQKLQEALESMKNNTISFSDIVTANLDRAVRKELGLQETTNTTRNAYNGALNDMANNTDINTATIRDRLGKVEINAATLRQTMENLRERTNKNFSDMAITTGNNMDTVRRKIDQGTDAIVRWNATEPETKRFSIIETIKRIFTGEYWRGYAEGTNYYPGGIGLVGEEGRELALLPTGKLAWVGVSGPELVQLPTGTKIFPHEKSIELAKMMNLPTFQHGGIMAGGTRYSTGTDIQIETPAPTIIIEQMVVRDDTDIHLISRELYNLQQNERFYRGRK